VQEKKVATPTAAWYPKITAMRSTNEAGGTC
jgi:hypothetical protein